MCRTTADQACFCTSQLRLLIKQSTIFVSNKRVLPPHRHFLVSYLSPLSKEKITRSSPFDDLTTSDRISSSAGLKEEH
jgi:hypothetical protein